MTQVELLPECPLKRFLIRLDGVQATGADEWVAQCPVHDDAAYSLTIIELPDIVTLRCDGGCRAEQVVQVMGLSMRDLHMLPVIKTTAGVFDNVGLPWNGIPSVRYRSKAVSDEDR